MHIIKICTGASCWQNFANENLKKAEEVLGIKAGETTKDGKFRLEKTGCLSHCEDGPNVLFIHQNGPLSLVMMDGKVENNMLPHHFEKKLRALTESEQTKK